MVVCQLHAPVIVVFAAPLWAAGGKIAVCYSWREEVIGEGEKLVGKNYGFNFFECPFFPFGTLVPHWGWGSPCTVYSLCSPLNPATSKSKNQKRVILSIIQR